MNVRESFQHIRTLGAEIGETHNVNFKISDVTRKKMRQIKQTETELRGKTCSEREIVEAAITFFYASWIQSVAVKKPFIKPGENSIVNTPKV